MMKLNQSCRKLLQKEPDPLHPIMPPINDSSTPSLAEEVRRPFPPNSNPFDTSMALTILVLLTALFFMTFFSFYIRRYSSDDTNSNSNPNPNNGNHPVQRSTHRAAPLNYSSSSAHLSKGLDAELIQLLPRFPYAGAAKHCIECSICLNDFVGGDTVKVIPYCRHAFHPPCIDTWLAAHVSCPVCRSTQLFGGVCEGVGGNLIGDGVGEASDGDNSWRSREVRRITAGDVRRTCSDSNLQNHTASLPRNSSF